MPDTAKPLKGLDVGVFEVAIAHRTDAFRAVYAMKLGEEIELVHERIRRIREMLK